MIRTYIFHMWQYFIYRDCIFLDGSCLCDHTEKYQGDKRTQVFGVGWN